MKKAMQQATRLGAKGIKVTCGGRLGGAEIARSETYHEGTIPLQTHPCRHRVRLRGGCHHLRPASACKVWIYKGEVLNTTLRARAHRRSTAKRDRRERRDRRGNGGSP